MSERHRLEDPEQIKKFVLGGNAIFTLVSKASGMRYTYKVRKKEEDDFWFVMLLNGQNNEEDFAYLGHMFLKEGALCIMHGKKSKIWSSAGSVVAWMWWSQLLAAPKDQRIITNRMNNVEFWHEGKCGRCGRKLTVPSSIESGFGPECINYI